jgi:hypothetical protein
MINEAAEAAVLVQISKPDRGCAPDQATTLLDSEGGDHIIKTYRLYARPVRPA